MVKSLLYRSIFLESRYFNVIYSPSQTASVGTLGSQTPGRISTRLKDQRRGLAKVRLAMFHGEVPCARGRSREPSLR